MAKEHKNTDFVLGRAKSALPQSDNSPPCRRVRTLEPGSAVAERNLGAARPLRNVIVAAYPLQNVIGAPLGCCLCCLCFVYLNSCVIEAAWVVKPNSEVEL